MRSAIIIIGTVFCRETSCLRHAGDRQVLELYVGDFKSERLSQAYVMENLIYDIRVLLKSQKLSYPWAQTRRLNPRLGDNAATSVGWDKIVPRNWFHFPARPLVLLKSPAVRAGDTRHFKIC